MFKSVVILLCSFLVAALTTRRLIVFLLQRGVVDVPNARSSHVKTTPRGGGIGIVFGLAIALLIASWLGMPVPGMRLLLGAALIAAVGFVDDLWGLSPLIRLGSQIAAAGIVLQQSGGMPRLPLPEPFDVPLELLSVPLSILWIVGLTNLYNFLDGIDGFAGLQGVVAGLGIALMTTDPILSCCGLAVAGACAGFLVYNWHPARVFMGDVGSSALGFFLAALPFQLAPIDRGTMVFGIAMCLWFFISDGVFTVLRRLFYGERIWVAHRSHLYQRLTGTGLRHDQVTLRVLGAGGILATLNVLPLRFGVSALQWAALSIAIGGFIIYYVYTWTRERVVAGPQYQFVPPSRLKPTVKHSVE